MRWNITCDVDPLKAVLVNAPGKEWKLSIPWNEEHPSVSRDIIDPDKARREHYAFQSILKANPDLKVFELEPALQNSLDVLSRSELREHFVKFLKMEGIRAKLSLEMFSARFILGREPDHFFNLDKNGALSPIVLPKKWAIFTRDMAVMTPRGLVICNSLNFERKKESFIMKAIFKYHPTLGTFTQIALDMSIYEQARLEGGDLIVKDDETLILGTGNLSNEQAAKILARKLDILVLAVTMPLWTKTWNMLNYRFMHLDTLFALVKKEEVLVFPYLFREENQPLAGIFTGLINDMHRHGLNPSKEFQEIPSSLKHLGKVTEFRPDGKVKRTKEKLLDYLDVSNDKVTYIGGDRNGYSSDLQHAFEALRQTRFQAANVLAKEPGILVAYARNKRTLDSLRGRCKIETFTADELVRCNGGPHCLSLPLLRF